MPMVLGLMADRVFMFADGSQAEARVVAWTGPVPLLKAWFTSGEDVHTNVAQLLALAIQDHKIDLPGGMFRKKSWRDYGPEDEERQIAKTTVHANNYGMGPEQFSFVTKIPERYAVAIQSIYFDLFPEIKSNYQANIDLALINTRTLKNPFGRERRFYGRLDDKTKREAYAWAASSTVGDWLSLWFTDLCELGWDVLLQLHDASGVSVGPVATEWRDWLGVVGPPPAEGDLEALALDIIRYSQRPIMINNEPLVIPVDFKVGQDWGSAKSWRLGNSALG
jgi:DNA polymerase family A